MGTISKTVFLKMSKKSKKILNYDKKKVLKAYLSSLSQVQLLLQSQTFITTLLSNTKLILGILQYGKFVWPTYDLLPYKLIEAALYLTDDNDNII